MKTRLVTPMVLGAASVPVSADPDVAALRGIGAEVMQIATTPVTPSTG